MDFPKAVAPYMVFDSSMCQIQKLGILSEGMWPLLHLKTLTDVSGPLKGEQGVDTTAFEHSVHVDDALHYVLYHMFGRRYSLKFNCELYLEDENGLSCYSTYRRTTTFPNVSKSARSRGLRI